MKKIRIISFTLLTSLLLVSCGTKKKDTKIESKGNAVTQTTVSETQTETSTTTEPNGVLKRAEYKADFSEDWNGLITSIDKVVVVELSDEEKENSMLENNFVVQVYYKITNNGDKDFNTYPDQGIMVIEGQQVDSEMFGSDSIGGEIMKGVTKEGLVTYSVPKIENVDAVKDIRLKWSADYDTDSWDEEFHKEFDVTFNLTK